MPATTRAILVFVPKAGGWVERTVDPGSAVVGFEDDWLDSRDDIHLYYMGNRFGSANMKTFADRAYHAVGRMREVYPTIAQVAADKSEVAVVGAWREGIEVQKTSDRAELALWLGIASSEVEPELKRTGTA